MTALLTISSTGAHAPVRPPLTRKRSNSSPSTTNLSRSRDYRPRRGSHVTARPLIGVRVASPNAATRRSQPFVLTTTQSPFSRLPSELVLHILQIASASSPSAAQTISLLSHFSRSLVLSYRFSLRTIRSVTGVHTFLARHASASPLTPLGALVTRLWLTDTLFWPAESVRAIVRACPNVQDLALTSLRRLAPWNVPSNQPGLFDASDAPLHLTVTGYTTAEDIRAFAKGDPATFAGFARRLKSLMLLKLRSVFHDRLAGILPGDVPPLTLVSEGEAEEELTHTDAVTELLLHCCQIKILSVPWAQVEQLVVLPGTQKPLVAEIAILKKWLSLMMGVAEKVELLLDFENLAGRDSTDLLKTHMAKVSDKLVVVNWPKNIDMAREAWLSHRSFPPYA
jgi:hypothetical protein